MICKQLSIGKFFTALLFVLLTALLAACGNASATTSSSTASTPTTTATCLTITTGIIQSISNTILQVTNVQGKTVQATLTSKTTFTRQATLTSADLKTGMLVSVTVTQNPDTTYSASSVSVRTSLTRQGGFRGGSGFCNGQRPFRNGTPGAFGGPGGPGSGSGNGQSRQTINGTISQVNGSSLGITDTSGNDFTVFLSTKTRISTQQTFTASDLRAGEAVTITGSANSQGGITASSVSILQGLPNRFGTPTATTSS